MKTVWLVSWVDSYEHDRSDVLGVAETRESAVLIAEGHLIEVDLNEVEGWSGDSLTLNWFGDRFEIRELEVLA